MSDVAAYHVLFPVQGAMWTHSISVLNSRPWKFHSIFHNLFIQLLYVQNI